VIVVNIKETSPPYLAGWDVAETVLHHPELARLQVNIAEGLYYTLKHCWDWSEYMFCNRFSNMVSKHRNHVKCLMSKRILFDENRWKPHYPKYHPISKKEWLLSDGISRRVGWDRHEPIWFEFSLCSWKAIDELCEQIHLPLDNVPGVPPQEDTADEERIDPRWVIWPVRLIKQRHVLIGR
jgi:hypothetical protein